MTHKTHGGETSIHLPYSDRRLICVDSNDQEHRPGSEELAPLTPIIWYVIPNFFMSYFSLPSSLVRKSEQGGRERQYQNEDIDENKTVVETDVRGREN
jgi:hypothetical protein